MVCGVVYSWYYCLDDAYIHLRYAENLLRSGEIGFTLGERNFGSSSPLYVLLLTALTAVTKSIFAPKILSLAFYGLLIALSIKSLRAASKSDAKLLWVGTLLVLCSPMSLRWLCNGMETGLIVVGSFWLAYTAWRGIEQRPVSPWQFFLGSLFLVLLRVEFLQLLGFVSLSLFYGSYASLPPKERSLSQLFRSAVETSWPCLGGLAGLGIVYLYFGSILPDTALAKQMTDPPGLISYLYTYIVRSHVGGSLFGVGIIGLCFISFVLVLSAPMSAVKKNQLVLLSLALPFLVVAVVVRSQAIQGVRYFLYVETFLLFVNLFLLGQFSSNVGLLRKSAAYALLWVGLVWGLADHYFFHRVTKGITASIKRFQETDLSSLSSRKGIAFEVGFVGYFTRADILDGYGLVNGRQIASLSTPSRIETFTKQPISFVFVNQEQKEMVAASLNLADWVSLGTFDFPNTDGRPDTHYLLVAPHLR